MWLCRPIKVDFSRPAQKKCSGRPNIAFGFCYSKVAVPPIECDFLHKNLVVRYIACQAWLFSPLGFLARRLAWCACVCLWLFRLVHFWRFSLLDWVAFRRIMMWYSRWLLTVAWTVIGFDQHYSEDKATCIVADVVCALCFYPCRQSENIKKTMNQSIHWKPPKFLWRAWLHSV